MNMISPNHYLYLVSLIITLVSESFFKFLKLEELNQKTFSNKKELKFSLFEYIECFYNFRLVL